jgi:hypothetical protein
MYIYITLNLGRTCSLQIHAPATLRWGQDPKYKMGSRLVGRKSRYERCGEERNLVILPGIEPQLSSLKTVSVQTELPRIIERNGTKWPRITITI